MLINMHMVVYSSLKLTYISHNVNGHTICDYTVLIITWSTQYIHMYGCIIYKTGNSAYISGNIQVTAL